MPNKLQEIKKKIEILDSLVVKSDFTKSFKFLIDFTKTLSQRITNEFLSLKANYQIFIEKIQNEQEVKLNEVIKKVDNKLATVINGEKGERGEDGKDADTTEVAIEASKLVQEAVLPLIPKIDDIEKNLPKLGGEIATALELLPEEEKLEISAIKGLKEKLEEKFSVRRLGGGGTSDIGVQMSLARLIKNETPSGTINGSNTVFNTTAEISAVLAFAINGMVINDDEYTVSGNTITFNTAIPTDLSGTSFRIKYV